MDGWKTSVSFWNGFLAGAMLVSGMVNPADISNLVIESPKIFFFEKKYPP